MFGAHHFLVTKVLFVSALFTLLASCSDNQETSASPKVRPAKLVKVQVASNQRDLSFPAIIRAAQSAELTF